MEAARKKRKRASETNEEKLKRREKQRNYQASRRKRKKNNKDERLKHTRNDETALNDNSFAPKERTVTVALELNLAGKNFLFKFHSYLEYRFGTQWYLKNFFHGWKTRQTANKQQELVFQESMVSNLEKYKKLYKEEVCSRKLVDLEFVIWNEPSKDLGIMCPVCGKLFQSKPTHALHLPSHFSQPVVPDETLCALLSPSLKKMLTKTM